MCIYHVILGHKGCVCSILELFDTKTFKTHPERSAAVLGWTGESKWSKQRTLLKWLVYWLLSIMTKSILSYSSYVHHMFIICSSYVHHMFIYQVFRNKRFLDFHVIHEICKKYFNFPIYSNCHLIFYYIVWWWLIKRL